MAKTLSIDGRIATIGQATSGFDYMRLCLAGAVLLWHSYAVVHGFEAGQLIQGSAAGLLPRLVLPMFFSLSGFLVASSLERTRSLRVFLTFRAMRILPALAVEVALSSLLIGPLVSQVGPADYFQSPVFHRYLLNMVGDISFHLPGVFLGNPWPGIVNASLWTVPYELECYVLLVAVQLLRLPRRPIVLALVTAALCLVFFCFFRKHSQLDLAIDPVPGRMLVLSFLAGVSIYAARDGIPYSLPLGFAAACVGAGCLSQPELQFLAPLPIAYVTVCLGLRNPPRNRLLLGGDYSYGLYLYGFVVQQCLMHVFGGVFHSTLLLFVVALAVTSLIAYGSWHAIERPILRLKGLVAGAGRSAAGARPSRGLLRALARSSPTGGA